MRSHDLKDILVTVYDDNNNHVTSPQKRSVKTSETDNKPTFYWLDLSLHGTSTGHRHTVVNS